jgi:sensor histidine kinase YesM
MKRTNLFLKRSIKFKLIFAYAVSMIIAITIAIIIYFFISEEANNKKLFENDLSITSLFNDYIHAQIDDVKLISNNIVTSNIVQEKLANNYIENEDGYYDELNKILISYDIVKSIYIIDKNHNVDPFHDTSWFEYDAKNFLDNIDFKALEANKGKISYSLEKDSYVNDNETKICLSRAIISRKTLEVVGYVIIFIDNDYLNKKYMQYFQSSTMQFMIRDQKGDYISFPSSGVISNVVSKDTSLELGKNKYEKLKYKNDIYKFVVIEASVVKGSLVATSKPINYNKNINLLLFVILIINFIFVFIYFFIIKRLILNPIYSITRAIEEVNYSEDLEIKLDIEAKNDEINKINIALNQMVRNLINKIEEIKKENLLQRKLEIDLLANQVKPHFLFNVLNVARALITLKKYEESKKLLNVTANYYRAWLNKGSDIITLRDEVTILKNYIEIMNIRGAEIFTINYLIDENLLEYKVPKLILQPIVENCIKHGIKETDECIDIQVKISSKCNSVIVIEVIDNGRGIEPEIVGKIYKRELINAESGFGVRSILDRLLLYYGESNPKEVMKIETVKNEYTKFILVLNENRLRGYIKNN